MIEITVLTSTKRTLQLVDEHKSQSEEVQLNFDPKVISEYSEYFQRPVPQNC